MYPRTVTCLTVLLVGFAVVACRKAIADREKPKRATAELELQAQSALNELMARMTADEGEASVNPRHPNFRRLNQSREEAAEALGRVVSCWKRKLGQVADSPITAPYENPQRLSLFILQRMSLSESELEMLVRHVATKSSYPLVIGDNPLREFPYAEVLSQNPPTVEQAIYQRFREVSPAKITDKEMELFADILRRGYGHDRQHLSILESRLDRESLLDVAGYHRVNIDRLKIELEKSSGRR